MENNNTERLFPIIGILNEYNLNSLNFMLLSNECSIGLKIKDNKKNIFVLSIINEDLISENNSDKNLIWKNKEIFISKNLNPI